MPSLKRFILSLPGSGPKECSVLCSCDDAHRNPLDNSSWIMRLLPCVRFLWVRTCQGQTRRIVLRKPCLHKYKDVQLCSLYGLWNGVLAEQYNYISERNLSEMHCIRLFKYVNLYRDLSQRPLSLNCKYVLGHLQSSDYTSYNYIVTEMYHVLPHSLKWFNAVNFCTITCVWAAVDVRGNRFIENSWYSNSVIPLFYMFSARKRYQQ